MKRRNNLIIISSSQLRRLLSREVKGKRREGKKEGEGEGLEIDRRRRRSPSLRPTRSVLSENDHILSGFAQFIAMRRGRAEGIEGMGSLSRE